MRETKPGPSNAQPIPLQNRRRALLAALAGAGIPLSERMVTGKWVTPVIDAVVLPSHAGISGFVFPLEFSGAQQTSIDKDRSLFADVINRSEKEILDLFIRTAEANTCGLAASCAGDGPVTVEVAATIDGSPSNSACIKARVNLDGGVSCSPKCSVFTFDAKVEGNSVTVENNCDLKLNNMSFDQNTFSYEWTYASGSITEKTGGDTINRTPGTGCESIPDICPTD